MSKIDRNYWWWANYCKAKMKPCPFCGGKGAFGTDHMLGALIYIVFCEECGVKKRFGESSLTKNRDATQQEIYRGLSGKALLFWNTRQ